MLQASTAGCAWLLLLLLLLLLGAQVASRSMGRA
jgi:hypothetical protein